MKLGKKTVIVGCGGSGKSYLAARLGEITGIEVVHLDRLYWLPGWVTRSKEEFDGMLEKVYEKDSYIMDGNFMRTMERRVGEADTVIWLDFPTLACIRGVISRVISYRGNVRPDMGDGCPERFDPSFMKWIVDFRKTTRPKIINIVDRARKRGLSVTVLRSRCEVNSFIADTEKQYE